MGSEKFCLRWNDFERNISNAFQDLRNESDFFDMTIVCDDEQIQAHKLVLSACSPFFRNVLKKNPHQSPLLYLKGVKFNEIIAVLNFMYHGEVNVAQEELNSFLSVAEDLKVKGLTQNQSEKQEQHRSERVSNINQQQSIRTNLQVGESTIPKYRESNPFPASIKTGNKTVIENDNDIIEEIPIKVEPREAQPLTIRTKDDRVALNSNSITPVDQTVSTYHDETGYDEYEQYEVEDYGNAADFSGIGGEIEKTGTVRSL